MVLRKLIKDLSNANQNREIYLPCSCVWLVNEDTAVISFSNVCVAFSESRTI